MDRVYILTDEQNRITQIEGEISLSNIADLSKAILIDEGEGTRYTHAQGNYLEKPLIDDDGCYNYSYLNGEVVERTAEEKSADVQNRPISYSESERLSNLENAFNEFVELVLGGEL